MNREPNFEASADMRLLELQRNALGVASTPTAWQNGGISEEASIGEAQTPARAGAVLRLEMAASPPDGVIAGALVTVSLALTNDGADEARGVIVCAPLPTNTSFRRGSLVHDGRDQPDDRAESLAGSGLLIDRIAAGARVSLVWKLSVKLGNDPLVLAPQVRAARGAVLGTGPLIVSRKPAELTGFGAELQRVDVPLDSAPAFAQELSAVELPIYELDEEEQLVYEAADAALEPIVPPSERLATPQPDASPPAPAPQAPPAPPEPAPLPERHAVALATVFDRATHAFFERIFSSTKPPVLLDHFLFGNALACSRGYDGDDDACVKQHLDAQAQLLHRMKLHEKLGRKEPLTEYAGAMLAQPSRLRESNVMAAPRLDAGVGVILVTELGAPVVTTLRKMEDEAGRWDFVKGRQLAQALQAQGVISSAPEAARDEVQVALREYAQRCAPVIQRFFVRARVDRTTGLLFAPEPSLDAAARGVLAALASVMPNERDAGMRQRN